MTREWKNWGRSVRSTPQSVVRPHSTREIVDTVYFARESGHSIRPIGAGHSFSGVAATEGVQLSLHYLRGIVRLDLAHSEVTFWAGTYLWEIPGLIGPYGLALENMGDIDRQSIAGAISTGTHGTGSRYGSMSTQVTALTFVTGTGEVRTVTNDDGDALSGLALSLGALGVFVTVTLRCVPAYLLHAVESPEPLESVLETLSERFDAHDHFEFYWFPHTSVARTKSNQRYAAGACETLPQSSLQRFLDVEVANNVALGGLVALQHLIPAATPQVNRVVSTISSQRVYRDHWNRVFATRRRVRFREMEYALPQHAIAEVMRELNQQIERKRLTVSFPVEVRSAAADELWLSPTAAQDVGYVAVHRYWREWDTEFFRLAEEIFREFSGLPHWGKMHTFTPNEYRSALPNYDRFLDLRTELDPDRVFRNGYLDQVLGE